MSRGHHKADKRLRSENPAAILGRKGGQASLKKYGKAQLKEWGKLGGRPKKATALEQLTEAQREGLQVIGHMADAILTAEQQQTTVGAPGYRQKCQLCHKRNGARKRCPNCRRMVCSDCWSTLDVCLCTFCEYRGAANV